MTNHRGEGERGITRQKQLYTCTNIHGNFVGDWVGQVKD